MLTETFYFGFFFSPPHLSSVVFAPCGIKHAMQRGKKGKVLMREEERNFDSSEGKSEQFVIILSMVL